jgi:UTP:GlnB (protein PII) uridylyltransferase
MRGSKIRFTETLLEVATAERRSVLGLVRSLLFDLRVEIVQVKSTVRDHGLVERFDVTERDGAPITRRRAAAIRSAVRKAIRGGKPGEVAA